MKNSINVFQQSTIQRSKKSFDTGHTEMNYENIFLAWTCENSSFLLSYDWKTIHYRYYFIISFGKSFTRGTKLSCRYVWNNLNRNSIGSGPILFGNQYWSFYNLPHLACTNTYGFTHGLEFRWKLRKLLSSRNFVSTYLYNVHTAETAVIRHLEITSHRSIKLFPYRRRRTSSMFYVFIYNSNTKVKTS